MISKCCDEKDLHPLEPNMGLLVLLLKIFFGTLDSLIYAFMSPNVGRDILIFFFKFNYTLRYLINNDLA